MEVVSNVTESAKIFVAVRCECGQGEDRLEEIRHERVRRSLNVTTDNDPLLNVTTVNGPSLNFTSENGTDVKAAR
jgi:hypothetical protein